MTTPTVPESAQPLYQAIQQRYPVGFETLRLGKDTALHILQVQDIEPLLAGKDPFADVSAFPFWVRLWEAALVLASFIASQPAQPGQTLLELGAGLGAPGLAAAQAGYTVTLSDYQEEILDFQRLNAATNGLTGISFQLLDWKAPPVMQQYDVIIGAEILFREEFFTPLLDLFHRLLAPGGTIYLAHDIRRKSLPAFLRRAEADYEIAVSRRTLRSSDETTTVILNRLRRRQQTAH